MPVGERLLSPQGQLALAVPFAAPVTVLSLGAKRCPVQSQRATAILRRLSLVKAKRKPAEQASEWLALAEVEIEDEKDGEELGSLESLNKISTAVVRVLLQENIQEVVALKDQLNAIGEQFTDEGDMKAATYVYVLLRLVDHVIPKLAEKLDGSYKEAFEKIFAILEDSGWQLKMEEEEEEEDGADSSSSDGLLQPSS